MLEDLGCDGYDFQIQTLFEASRMASEIRELPITFRDRESGESKLDLGRKLVAEKGWSKVTEVCLGGVRRQDSVREGLNKLKGCDWVVIHDGARPFLTLDLIRDGLKAGQVTGAAVVAVPVKDTIKLGDGGMMVKTTLNRQALWAVQTPQTFRFDIITKAHEQITADVTDDASMVEQLGYKVKLYMGSYDNIKITTPEDLALAEVIARNRKAE